MSVVEDFRVFIEERMRMRMRILIFYAYMGKIYAYIESARKESMRSWRMCVKNLSAHGECVKSIYAHMEKALKESMRTRRKSKQNLQYASICRGKASLKGQ